MKKKVISMVSLLLISVILCSVFSGCSSGGKVENKNTYRSNLGMKLTLDGSNNTFSETFADNVVKSGTYTYKNGIVTFDDKTSWIVEKDVLINKEQYKRMLVKKGKMNVKSNEIIDKFGYKKLQVNKFSEMCIKDRKTFRYLLGKRGFVYADDVVVGYYYDDVFIPNSNNNLVIKEDVFN